MANEEKRDESPEEINGQINPALIGVNGTSNVSDIESMVLAASEEYNSIDQTLDEIDSWMTKLEEQNDNLFTELEELLQSSRQARKELQEQQEQDLLEKQKQLTLQNEQDKKQGES